MAEIVLRPQPGAQEAFHASKADIAIYGGSAGSGKSYALVLEPVRHYTNPRFGGVIFRRTSPELSGSGSMWEEATGIYPLLGAKMRESPSLSVEFPSGALLQFMHLQYTSDAHAHQGKQYAFIGFDQLEHFEAYQFWYLVSRMRSISGIKPYLRATVNPDPDSFVRKLIEWWIGDDGYPVKEKSGKIRWFVRDGDTIIWADKKEELKKEAGDDDEPMSLTFIAAKLDDNPALNKKDPGYRARLKSLPEIERKRLLDGNWDVRPEGGKYVEYGFFERRWTKDTLPPLNIYIASDYATKEPQEGQEPDFTEHGVFGISPDDDLYVLDWWYGQTKSDVWVESFIDKVARWKPACGFGESGSIQKTVEPFLRKRMRERRVNARLVWLPVSTGGQSSSQLRVGYKDPSKRAKAVRGRAFQARAAMKKVIFPANAEWADRVIDQVVNFPIGKDDAFDVMSHMCLAIDRAYGAIIRSPQPKPKRHDYSGKWSSQNEPDAWKYV